MDRPRAPALSPPRTEVERTDAARLSSVVSMVLATSLIDEDALRFAVWTYVDTQRIAGASPGELITALTDLIEAARITPASIRQARLRRLILWCVEAYFGHLGGDVLAAREVHISGPRRASNR